MQIMSLLGYEPKDLQNWLKVIEELAFSNSATGEHLQSCYELSEFLSGLLEENRV